MSYGQKPSGLERRLLPRFEVAPMAIEWVSLGSAPCFDACDQDRFSGMVFDVSAFGIGMITTAPCAPVLNHVLRLHHREGEATAVVRNVTDLPPESVPTVLPRFDGSVVPRFKVGLEFDRPTDSFARFISVTAAELHCQLIRATSTRVAEALRGAA